MLYLQFFTVRYTIFLPSTDLGYKFPALHYILSIYQTIFFQIMNSIHLNACRKENFLAIKKTRCCKEYGLDLISMIAPTSHQRIQTIAKEANGFIYCVSSLGVTGVRSKITTDIGAMVDLVREVTDVPVAVGFGISTLEQTKKMASQSDGAIVGSAIIKIIEKYGKDAPQYVEAYVKEMVDAIK